MISYVIKPPRFSDGSHFISLGAGVQSTTLYLMAAHGLIEPVPTAAIFADTGWEPPDIYQHLEWLKMISPTLPVPISIRVIKAGDLYDDVWNHRTIDGKDFYTIPTYTINENGAKGISHRQCTTQYKIRPIVREVRDLIERPAGRLHSKPPFAVQWLGISYDELHRIKDSTVGWIDNVHPLVDMNMTRNDCLEWFNEHYPSRPLVKSSCIGCPYHSDSQWLDLYRKFPAEMAKTVELDNRMRSANEKIREPQIAGRYLYRKFRPLKDVLEQLDTFDLQSPRLLADADGFGNECEGHCGV